MENTNSGLLNNGAILKEFKITLNDIVLSKEDIITTEILWDKSKLDVTGSVVIKDTFNLSNLGIFDGATVIDIYSVDIFDTVFHRKFRITKVLKEKYNGTFDVVVLNFMDEVSYKLKNTYIGKSFNGKLSDCISSYFDHLEISKLLEATKIKLDIEDTSIVSNFAVPQDRSFYDFISQELKLQGYTWFQTRNSLHIVGRENLLIESIEKIEHPFTDKTANAMYSFKIHDIKHNFNDLLSMNSIPDTKNL